MLVQLETDISCEDRHADLQLGRSSHLRRGSDAVVWRRAACVGELCGRNSTVGGRRHQRVAKKLSWNYAFVCGRARLFIPIPRTIAALCADRTRGRATAHDLAWWWSRSNRFSEQFWSRTAVLVGASGRVHAEPCGTR